MAIIVVHRAHRLGLQEARRRVEQAASRYGDRFGIHGIWDGDEFLVARAGAKARVRVTAETVIVELELGRVFNHWQGRVQNAIERYLDEHLAA